MDHRVWSGLCQLTRRRLTLLSTKQLRSPPTPPECTVRLAEDIHLLAAYFAASAGGGWQCSLLLLYPSFLLTFNRRRFTLLLIFNRRHAISDPRTEVLQGTLDLMVLKTLDSMGPQHGYGIARRIEQLSNDLLRMNQGTLYPPF